MYSSLGWNFKKLRSRIWLRNTLQCLGTIKLQTFFIRNGLVLSKIKNVGMMNSLGRNLVEFYYQALKIE